MQVSTIYNDTLITGVVLQCTPFFIEVAITSPFTKLSSSRSLPAGFRQQIECLDERLKSECSSLLIELYEVADRFMHKQTDAA